MKLIPIKKEDIPTLEEKLEKINTPDYGDKLLDTETWALVEAIPEIIDHSEKEVVGRLRSKEFNRTFYYRSDRAVPFIALDQQAIHQLVWAQQYLSSQLSTAKDHLDKFIQLYSPQGAAFKTGSHTLDLNGHVSGLFGGRLTLHGSGETESTTTYCGGRAVNFSLEAGKPYLSEMVNCLLRCRKGYWHLTTASAVLLSLGHSKTEVSEFAKGKELSAGLKVNALNSIFSELPFSAEQLSQEEECVRRFLSFRNALGHLEESQPKLNNYRAYYNHYNDQNRHYRRIVGRVAPGVFTGDERWNDILWDLTGEGATLAQELNYLRLVGSDVREILQDYFARKPALVLPQNIDPIRNPKLLLTAPKL